MIGRKFTRGKVKYGGLSGEMYEIFVGPLPVVGLIVVMFVMITLLPGKNL